MNIILNFEKICDITYSLLYNTPSLPHTCLTVVGHPIKSLLSQNSCWFGSRVVGLAVVVVWWQKDPLSILRLPSVHLALANSQLDTQKTCYSIIN